MKSLQAAVLASAAFLLAAVAAVAQGPDGGMGPGPGGPGFGMHRPPLERSLGLRGPQGRWWNDPDLVQKLQLTDDQRKAMDQILLDHRAKLIDMRAAVEKAELGMEPLLREDQPNESQILAQIDKVAQARAELEKANARFLLAIRSKLSPDQWKQLQDARADRMHRRGRGERGPQHQLEPPPHAGPDGGPQGTLNQMPPPDHAPFDPVIGDR
jgi:Spy/CpxP family protein refolding chaperone